MKKYIYLTMPLLIYSLSANAQGKIKDGTVIGSPSLPNASAVFEVESNNKGFLMPRLSLTNTLVWGLTGSPVTGGMTVYNTNASITGAPTAPIISGGVGVYYWDGTRWVAGTGQQKAQADSTYWGLKGNTGLSSSTTVGTVVAATNFLGTTDAANLSFATNNTNRMIIGQNANAYGGTGVSASGAESFSWGQADTVSSNASVAFGIRNRVESSGAFVAGRDNKISSTANFSAVFGDNNRDSATNTIVVGNNNKLNNQSNMSLVIGGDNKMENPGAVSGTFLSYNLISGGGNVINADGINNVSGNAATSHNIISGQTNTINTSANSAVFGYANTVNYSDGCIVAGFLLQSQKILNSAVLGAHNIDSSNHSLVCGANNIVNATMPEATVIGRYNIPVNNALFTIGNGISGVGGRSNAFVVSSTSTTGASVNGLIVLIPSLPSYASDAAATADTSLPAGGLYKIGNDIRIK
jgi:hypothetical protein